MTEYDRLKLQKEAILRREAAAIIASSPEGQVCAEIREIMATCREQEAAGRIDTPGGLEHMGDVWVLLAKWDRSLKAEPTRYCVLALGHSGECMFFSFTYLGGDKCSAESPDEN